MSTIRLPPARLVELLTIAIALAPALVDQISTDPSPEAWSLLSGYTVVAVAALVVRGRYPVSAFICMLTALAGASIMGAVQEVQLSNLSVLPLAFSVYAVGAGRRLGVALMTLGGAAALVGVGLAVNHATAGADWRGGSDVLATIAPLPVAWALGVARQSQHLALHIAEQRAARNTLERQRIAEQAVAAERGRIAREMHDVVAHSLTLLVVHAESIRARSGDLPLWTREQIDALSTAGRQATVEMRELLGLLRNGTPGEAPRTPAPTLAELPALVESARTAGNLVTVNSADGVHLLPRPVQLAAYRILQESLANARRHAPGSTVRIELTAHPKSLEVEVVSGRPPRRVTPVPGEGIGLISMQERVTALGGSFSAGPTAEGFRVKAVLPLPMPPSQDEAPPGG